MIRKCIFWVTFYAVLCGMAVLAWGQNYPCPDCPDCVVVAVSTRRAEVMLASEARLEPGGYWSSGTMLYVAPLAEVRDAVWLECVTGPGVMAESGCRLLGMDVDRDGDVDMLDFVEGVR